MNRAVISPQASIAAMFGTTIAAMKLPKRWICCRMMRFSFEMTLYAINRPSARSV
jgi:hypothetical protein